MSYVDFGVSSIELDKLTLIARRLGYRALLIEDGESLVSSTRMNGVTLVKKQVITSLNEVELRKALSTTSKSIVVSVRPLGVSAARLAARDSRVDAVVLDLETLNYIDKQQFSMMKRFSKPVELPLKLITMGERALAKVIRRLIYAAHIEVPIVFSSKASDWSELYYPKSIALLLSQMLSLEPVVMLSGFITIPREILVRKGVKL
ncbi:MAG: hypothetical protein RMI83_03925 [Desulfurococcaceae archaeon]|nr:hypothetical protein [Sulfolobales archaeon]MDW8170235.1 hypothetical protein [Desulfurococcaceae archaeon]